MKFDEITPDVIREAFQVEIEGTEIPCWPIDRNKSDWENFLRSGRSVSNRIGCSFDLLCIEEGWSSDEIVFAGYFSYLFIYLEDMDEEEVMAVVMMPEHAARFLHWDTKRLEMAAGAVVERCGLKFERVDGVWYFWCAESEEVLEEFEDTEMMARDIHRRWQDPPRH